MTRKILCVDDEPNILQAYERQLHTQFQIDTALGGEQGLAMMSQQGPYAVVVSDLRMPRMDGVQFLWHVKEQSPDTVRIILSGQSDFKTTIGAVNSGNIFRFLTKPCPPDMLAKTLESALEQYRLVIAERELLEKTLSGTIKVLTEILSLVNPTAFSRADRVRRYMRHMAVQLELPNIWEFELAALLSQIGCITVPPSILSKVYAGKELEAEEQEIFAAHPAAGCKLLAKIPRLESIAQMIALQQKPPSTRPLHPKSLEVVALGGQMLRIAIDFDQRLYRGSSRQFALTGMRNRQADYNPDLLATLETIEIDENERELRMVRVHDLASGMIIQEDVVAKNGLLLVSKGQEATEAVIRRLWSFARIAGVKEPFQVCLPKRVDS